MSDAPKAEKPRGFTCPDCRGVRLFVYRTQSPAKGRVVRYRACSACGYRVATEERVARVLNRKKRASKAAKKEPVQIYTSTSDSRAA